MLMGRPPMVQAFFFPIGHFRTVRIITAIMCDCNGCKGHEHAFGSSSPLSIVAGVIVLALLRRGAIPAGIQELAHPPPANFNASIMVRQCEITNMILLPSDSDLITGLARLY